MFSFGPYTNPRTPYNYGYASSPNPYHAYSPYTTPHDAEVRSRQARQQALLRAQQQRQREQQQREAYARAVAQQRARQHRLQRHNSFYDPEEDEDWSSNVLSDPYVERRRELENARRIESIYKGRPQQDSYEDGDEGEDELENLEARFEALKSSFIPPSILDYTLRADVQEHVMSVSTSKISLSSVADGETVLTPASDVPEGEKAPSLAYTSHTTPVHAHTEALLRLLNDLDAVPSWGDRIVRTARRDLARRVEGEAARVEEWVRAVWRARQSGAASNLNADFTDLDAGAKTASADTGTGGVDIQDANGNTEIGDSQDSKASNGSASSSDL
ncbi:hypothetical protein OF83DRAFT_1085303 [Amylostereum chailletii]|nr:hypothetical protein OF83DRAFT_1085303 [Amylostereum chailletii]